MLTQRERWAAAVAAVGLAIGGLISIEGCNRGSPAPEPRVYSVPVYIPYGAPAAPPGPSAGDIDDVNRLDRLNKKQDAALGRK